MVTSSPVVSPFSYQHPVHWTALTLYNLNYFNLDAPRGQQPRLVHIKILNGP